MAYRNDMDANIAYVFPGSFPRNAIAFLKTHKNGCYGSDRARFKSRAYALLYPPAIFILQLGMCTHYIAIKIELGQVPLAAKLTVKVNGRGVRLAC